MLKRAAKERKSILDSVTEATQSASKSDGTREGQIDNLNQIISSLQAMKRKLADASITEKEEAGRCKARLEHLKSIGRPDKNHVIAWNKQRLDRILVDHMLRSGQQGAAKLLIDRGGIKELVDSSIFEHAWKGVAKLLINRGGINELVDSSIFEHAWKVVEALKSHSCTEALRWCEENHSRLKRTNCKLEFQLRIQEFIELVRLEKRVEALTYARRYLAPWASQYMQELQQAVTTLVFTQHTTSKYKVFFEEEQWQKLVDLFLQELYKLHHLTAESLMLVHLQAGLSALNTPQAYETGSSKEDPLHLPAFKKLAEGLPLAKHVHSKLVCSVTKDIMNDANPPMVLPNGYVYSARAVEMIGAQNDGDMVCPKTGSKFSADELRRFHRNQQRTKKKNDCYTLIMPPSHLVA
eukprot:gene23017-30210_t